jgi:hypothetical protein
MKKNDGPSVNFSFPGFRAFGWLGGWGWLGSLLDAPLPSNVEYYQTYLADKKEQTYPIINFGIELRA